MFMKTVPQPITVGCQVELELVDRSGNKERISFAIVEDKAADFSQGYMSEDAPLARAVMGEKAGSVIPYLKDDIFSVQILSVSRSARIPTKEAADRRQAEMKKITREVQDTNAMVFASSFSGKWGDYDPDSIPKEDGEEEKK